MKNALRLLLFLLRNRLISFLVLLTVLNIGVYSQDNIKPKIKCEYLLYVPQDYTSCQDSFPLIIYLHGSGRRGSDLNKLKENGLPYLIDKGNNYEFIIASPQCPENTYWSKVNWFDSLYLDLISKYRIDEKRIYITGISMGGFGTWQAAMDYPDKITAIVPLCGGCNDSIDICRINKIPIWTFHGAADTITSVNETQKLVTRLNECNGNIRFTRLENEGHAIQFIYEKNPEIYKWMLDQKK